MVVVSTLTQTVSLLLTFASYSSAQDDGGTCCDLQQNNSKDLPTLELPIQALVDRSPLYGTIFSSPDVSEEANSCYTYLKMSDCRYLQFICTKEKSGSITVKTSIVSDNNPNGGVYRVEGSYGNLGNETTVHDTYVFDVVCSGCDYIYITYRNYLFDSCEFINYDCDIVYGLSTSPNSAPPCLDRAEEVVNASGLQVAGFTRATGMPTCVKYFNGATVINADRIDPAYAYAISYPDDSNPCC